MGVEGSTMGITCIVIGIAIIYLATSKKERFGNIAVHVKIGGLLMLFGSEWIIISSWFLK